jgi:hypothetical protein
MQPTIENAKLLVTLLAVIKKENSNLKDKLLEELYSTLQKDIQNQTGVKYLQVEDIENPIPVQVFHGERGLQGARGATGPRGIQGIQGETGKTGDIGPRGVQGVRGLTGERGESGERGEQGLPGKDGKDADIKPVEERFQKLYDEFISQISSQITRMALARGNSGVQVSAGSGEVLLKFLDDVDYQSISTAQDEYVLTYNASTKKWEARESTGGDVANSYLTSTYVANTRFQSVLANTNAFIATKVNTTTFNEALANTNSYIAANALTERQHLANTNAFIATKVNTTTFNSALANTNSFIKSQLANTNYYIDANALIERQHLANTNSFIAANALIERQHLANTNSFIKSQLANTNTRIASVISSPFVFTTNGIYRTLTGYVENGTTNTVRVAEFSSSQLRLTLATFTPSMTASGLSSSSLNWDVAATGFSVSVDNPSDVLDQYISSVLSISQTAGSIYTTLAGYTAGAKSAVPAGGIDWTQSFTATGSSFIRPVSSSSTGGTATGLVRFNVFSGSSESEYTTSTASFTINWANPTHSISLTPMSGQTFLSSYSSTSYSVSGTGITTSANRVFAVTASNGTVSNATGSGTFTFTAPIHKTNNDTSRTVTLNTTLTRPISVTGTSYTATLGPNSASHSATFTYPSFAIFTSSTSSPPSRADIVSGTTFESTVTQYGDQVKTVSGNITNSSGVPQGYWFAVRTAASQPTTFKTGASVSLLSDVATTTSSVNLEPDSPLSGYTAEAYTLYGITLQNGTTYVSIS